MLSHLALQGTACRLHFADKRMRENVRGSVTGLKMHIWSGQWSIFSQLQEGTLEEWGCLYNAL
jgi:hypothetical protein